MGSVLVDLIPLMIGAIALPVWIIIVLLLLQSESGINKALAFIGGATLVRVVQGILFGFVFGAANDAGAGGPVKNTLLLILGILLWIAAIIKLSKKDDPDAPPPKWMASIGGMSALHAFGAGALLTTISPKLWVFTLSALATVQDAELGAIWGSIAYLLFVFVAQSILLAVVAVAAFAPQQSTALLDSLIKWLGKHAGTIGLIMSILFGTYFLWKGITGLAG